tara:strand:- start:22 stop:534 length:513 start_codon:yes stop_codon:yes gene_type:complete
MQHNTAQTPGNADSQDQGWLALFAFVALCLVVGGVGGIFTAGSVETWYPTLDKPPFNPPNWVFGPVWTALYVLMGAAAWRVWRRRAHPGRRAALAWFGAQLALNLLWSLLFFGLMMVGAALIEIVILWGSILSTAMRFKNIDSLAAWMFVPYLAWVSFATVLNGSIWWLN